MANPVQPTSSKKPAVKPTARPSIRTTVPSSTTNSPGRNSEEKRESISVIAVAASGAASSATANQRVPTRHFSNRDPSARRPCFPSIRQVKRTPLTLGPATIASSASGNRGLSCAPPDDEEYAAPRDGEREHEVRQHRMLSDEGFDGCHGSPHDLSTAA